ncbi:MAG: integrase [Paenibacillaceae bacterium]
MIKSEKIINLSKNRSVISTGKITFNQTENQKNEIHFNNLQAKGIIIQGQYHDRNWIMKNGNYDCTFIFDLDMYVDIQHALKCWVVLKKANGYVTSNTLVDFNKLKQIVFLTEGFKLEKLNLLEEFIHQATKHVRLSVADAVIDFLNYYILPIRDSYIDACLPFTGRITSIRSLPPYQDILLFNEVIERFSNECSFDEKVKFYPVLLWWKITKIIPLRPSEFRSIRRDALSITPEGAYNLKVPRKKEKRKNLKEIEITDTLQINYETYIMIKEYLSMTEHHPSSPYLLSYWSYYYSLNDGRNNFKYKKNTDYLEGPQFRLLLSYFYAEIVKGKYGYSDLIQVSPGDTRHFAFCNMMLQGFNMLSIARMGGHRSLHSQMHYHSHLDYYAQSFVYVLSKTYKMKKFNESSRDPSFNSSNIFAKAQIYVKSDFQETYEVEYGYCTYHPSKCLVGDCRYCEHFFIPKDRLNEATDWLTDSSERLKHRISEQLELMKRISMDMSYNFQTFEFQNSGQENLLNKANELNRLIRQKAIVDSFFEEVLN